MTKWATWDVEQLSLSKRWPQHCMCSRWDAFVLGVSPTTRIPTSSSSGPFLHLSQSALSINQDVFRHLHNDNVNMNQEH